MDLCEQYIYYDHFLLYSTNTHPKNTMECSQTAAWATNKSLLVVSSDKALPESINSDSTLPIAVHLEGSVIGCCCCCCCCCRPHSTNVLPAESSTRNHVAASSLSPQVARKGSTLSGFVQRSRLEREVGRDLHSNKWEEV